MARSVLTDRQVEAGAPLERPCLNYYHGMRNSMFPQLGLLEYDPKCQTCFARVDIMGEHDHLHLGAGVECVTPGIGGVPGRTVKCKCGAFHH